MTRRAVIGDATLYLGDCRELAQEIVADTVISDPPYGIGFKWKGARRGGRNSGLVWAAHQIDRQPDWDDVRGDDAEFDPSPWLGFPEVILWGANNYAALPPARCWLVWDKRAGMSPDHHGDCELAWTNLNGVIRCHRQIWRGVVRQGEENVANTAKSHPVQKPVGLMGWCVELTAGQHILDPFMGSGTTGIAALRLGRKFTGIEIERRWFDIACRRIEAEARQPKLQLSEAPARPVQEVLL